MINVRIVATTSSSITFEIVNGRYYDLSEPLTLTLIDGEQQIVAEMTTKKVINTFYHLEPLTSYCICAQEIHSKEVWTQENNYTLDVRDFGAIGDGIHNATTCIQAAILSCPAGSKVLIPEGTYLVTSLFLKSHMELEIGSQARLIGDTNPDHFPIFPDMLETKNNEKYFSFGPWEGNPHRCYASIINAVNVEDVKIYGEGIIDGKASYDNWWKDPKHKRKGIARPRLFFANNAQNILLEGLTFQNSPAWTIHPLMSTHMDFINLTIINPKVSPNTDGIDPESCKNVTIQGVHFSLGDDCIAIKSGKIYIAEHGGLPSTSIVVRQCLMENGHGAVTLGSEIACGVNNVVVSECKFINTDRGLRIKTRRGRGERSIIDQILFDKIQMKGVKIPFVLNSYYFCDPDGHSDYVQTRAKLPVDERTPKVGQLTFQNIEAIDCEIAVSSMEGLTEQPIEKLVFDHITVSFKEDAEEGLAAMCDGAVPMKKRGFIMNNVLSVSLNHINMKGYIGAPYILDGVAHEL